MGEEKKEEGGLDPERQRILEEYAKQNPGVPVESAPELETTEQSPVETDKEQPPKKEITPSVEETEEQRKEREAKESEKSENLKKALDEERGKRKRLREEKEELEAKIRDYEAKQTHAQPLQDDAILDYEAELKTLKANQKSMELREAQREAFSRQEAVRRESDRLYKMVKDVNKELADEGFPGFEYMAGTITTELLNMNSVDPEEAKALDNPAGWKKIFKENIYPRFKKEFEESTRKSTLDKKVALKEQANLSGPGKGAPKKSDDDDPKNWDEKRRMSEYRKIRGM